MSALPAIQDVTVLIPAAGEGERLGLGPKALLPLGGRRVIDWVVDKATRLGDEILIAAPPGLTEPAGCRLLAGGPTRQDSVRRLAAAATRPWVVVWDAARPFGSVALARAVLAAAAHHGIAAAVPPERPDAFETPLAFARPLLQELVEQAHRQGWVAASTMELALRAGHAVKRVLGETSNLKLTAPQDWLRASGLTHWLSA